MTELETHLLSALRSLHEEFKIQHDEYMKSANELRQMFDVTMKRNDEIEAFLKDLTEQLNRS